jgi:hypothetical protein
MRFTLAPGLVTKIAHIPETSMGFHILDVVLRNGSVIRNVVVLSGNELAADHHAGCSLSSSDIINVFPSASSIPHSSSTPH